MNHYSPKIITTLLIGYTPIQNKKLQKKKKRKIISPGLMQPSMGLKTQVSSLSSFYRLSSVSWFKMAAPAPAIVSAFQLRKNKKSKKKCCPFSFKGSCQKLLTLLPFTFSHVAHIQLDKMIFWMVMSLLENNGYYLQNKRVRMNMRDNQHSLPQGALRNFLCHRYKRWKVNMTGLAMILQKLFENATLIPGAPRIYPMQDYGSHHRYHPLTSLNRCSLILS